MFCFCVFVFPVRVRYPRAPGAAEEGPSRNGDGAQRAGWIRAADSVGGPNPIRAASPTPDRPEQTRFDPESSASVDVPCPDLSGAGPGAAPPIMAKM